jgi:hypothetical protein
MRHRSLLGALLMIGLVLPLTSCSVTPELTSISVSPASVTASYTAGLQVEFIAIGSYTRPGHTAVTKDITDQVTWTSSFEQGLTINSNGVATVQGYGYGTGQVFAEAPGFHGAIVGTADFTISPPPTTSSVVKSLTLLQDSKAPATQNSSVHFTAMGKTSDGTLVKLNGQPKWTSSDNQIATIDQSTGLVTTLGAGRSTIIAVYTNPDGTTAVGVTHLNVSEN